jgi:hypothetical protein
LNGPVPPIAVYKDTSTNSLLPEENPHGCRC